MLKLDGVSKNYKVGTFGSKELPAVRNVTFQVPEGEVVSLIGESGSGKSTIGKMILRLTSISAGKIWFDDLDVATIKGNALKEYYRRVQGVFQDPFSSYNPIFKADRIFRTIHDEFFPGVPAAEWNDKVDASMESVGLNPEHVLDKFPHQLSGGQLQRFLIARALLLDVRFLVADEIISMLDASTRIDVLNLLADLKARGLSILFITHDLSLAHYISEQAVILYRGCVAEMGETDKIFDHPRHPYTQMLMASVPRLDKKWDDGKVDLAAKPLLAPSGCVYYDRCPIGDAACTRDLPPLVETETGHVVACIHQKEIERV
ncbi:MAG: ABC transporter ATP-binding protein [Chloroflexi bacterium]|nr:ABC transporter ATP-binding protein [Chloroflexota bacterium]